MEWNQKLYKLLYFVFKKHTIYIGADYMQDFMGYMLKIVIKANSNLKY